MFDVSPKLGLVIAVPHTGRGLHPTFTWGLFNLHAPINFTARHITNIDDDGRVRVGGVADLRNRFMEQAIEMNAKYLFFIDEDVTVPSYTLRQLIFVLENYPDVAIAGGIYVHKTNPSFPLVFRGNGIGSYWDWKLGELFEVTGLGMGCTMLRVDAFKEVEPPWFETVDLPMINPKEGEPATPIYMTEDLYACGKVREKGWKIYADTSVVCTHWDLRTMTPYRIPERSNPLRKPPEGEGKRIIDLGCGENPYHTDEGVVHTVDIREEVHPTWRADIRNLSFINPASYDIVHSSHTLEHIPRTDVLLALGEWARILKPNGELRLVLPNLEWAAEKLLKNQVDNDVYNVLYGAQENPKDFHCSGFTPMVIAELLKTVGFEEIELTKDGYNMFVKAIYPSASVELSLVATP